MNRDTSPDTGDSEVEIHLDDGAELTLQQVAVDADERPMSFEVHGIIENVDEGILEKLRGKAIDPVSVRFKVSNVE